MGRVPNKMRIRPEHVEAARALVKMSQVDLATACGLSEGTIRYFETETRILSDASVYRIQLALEHCGIEFLNSGRPGVRYHPDRDRRRLTAAATAKPVE